MSWFQLKPKITKDLDELTQAYNEKYGHFDYTQDSRSLDASFERTLLEAVGDISNLNVLVCGSNSGYEIKILSPLFPSAKFTAVDISTEALDQISGITTVHADMQKLPFTDKSFDMYLNCRAIHSSDVNMESAVREAIRVAKGRIVLSISNGYKIDNKIVNGMYDYDLKDIDPAKPNNVVVMLKKILEEGNYDIKESASDAEIFLVANPR